MRPFGFAALGLAAYSVFLVATIPTAYVGAQLQAVMPGRIDVADPSGTLWRGSASLRLPQAAATLVDRVEWRFVPSRIFAGEIAFDTRHASAGIAGDMRIARTPSRWLIRDARIEGDAAAIASFVPLVATWRPAGQVVAVAPSVALDGRSLIGEATVEWRGAATALSEVKPLGSYRATWRAAQGPGRIEVSTLQGPLRVRGEGTTAAPMQVRFTGEASAQGESAKALEPLLDLMGPRRPDGARALELRIER